MNIKDLKNRLLILHIPENEYSLDGSLKPDSIILYKNYRKWEVFYLDERGTKNNERNFDSESDACLYIYKLFVDSKKIKQKFKIN
ncbi:hypothetical protein F0358_05040 [Empedobacter brevis]|uniref:hypothetical protein n=1 Tax=Empedobacter brevis TaxID=247 RepID=UPI00123C85FE|nr:hypothetical protein [Empedobacter brevis]QES92125.1 hypothetical protein F0358_05040 [Empedobacter brevis]